jgi:DNA-binding transcriptional ArsR family regulator
MQLWRYTIASMSAVAVDDALVALAHPARRRLVQLCADRERSVGELGRLTALRQPAASQHLRVLRDAGLVTVRRDGNRRLYRVDFERLARVRAALDGLWGQALPELKRASEARAAGQARVAARASDRSAGR